MKKKLRINTLLQIIFFFVLIIIDRLSKVWASGCLKDSDAIPVIKNIIEFRYLENTGAAFGILENAMWLFYVITIVVFLIILFIWIKIYKGLRQYTELSEDKFKNKTFSNMSYLGYLLAALAAGAIGNLYDRVFNNYVVDFIYFRFINFPIFNFADICVTISIILICILFIFIYKDDPNLMIFKDKKTKNNDES